MADHSLLVNLVSALVAALLGALLAIRLRQSVILGFILAGVVISPSSPGVVADRAAVEALADIGIIFLLFTIGLQLSFGDLMRVGRVAVLGGLLQVVLMIGVGYGVGIAVGWGWLESLYLGAVLSNSSSTVISKVLGDRGELEAEPSKIALAWSTVQDLSTIVLVVILSTLSVEGASLAVDLPLVVGRAVLFLAVLIPVGLRIFPWVFERIAVLRSREVFILTAATVALATAYVSSFFGLSLALGAFVAGLVVGESDLSHQILGEVIPVRDVLAGIFFVSVGMLVDPLFVVTNLPLVLLVLFLIVVVKGLLSAAIGMMFGYSPRTSLLTGVALAQCAEFSFLLARLSQETGAVGTSGYSLMLAGAAGSIMLAPALHAASGPLVGWLERRLPISPLAHDPAVGVLEESPRRYAVLCGYGDVGRLVGAALRRQGFRYVVIEQDPAVVRRLRDAGVPALLGNAGNPVLLDRARLERARVVVSTIPDPFATRQMVEYVRQNHPRLDIVARTHSLEEMRVLTASGANEAVVGEVEVALEVTRHTLRRFGVSAAETLAVVQRLRAQESGGRHLVDE